MTGEHKKPNLKSTKYLTALIFSVLLIICLIPAAANAAEPEQQDPSQQFPVVHATSDGHIHVDVDINHGSKGMSAQETTAEFPEKYDPRDEDWYQGVTVDDQGMTSLCWACAASQAAQISYAKETGSSAQYKLSPAQLGYYYYNRVNDPLLNTENDYNQTFKLWHETGGNMINTLTHMSTWNGLVPYDQAPITLDWLGYYIGQASEPGESLPQYLAYNANALIEENCTYFKSIDNDKAGIAFVKGLIKEYGGVVVSMDASMWFFAQGDNYSEAFYNPYAYDINNHEVVIVGWDDNYPRTNFASGASYKSYKNNSFKHRPSDNGAWIVLNSWGTEYDGREVHDNGYFYASYESADLLSDGICAFDMMKPDTYDYNYQYDGSAYDDSIVYFKNEKAANVFTAASQIRLDAVSFVEWNDALINYDIDVYTGLTSDGDPESGVLAAHADYSTDSAGYKTVKIPGVVIDKGETFAIVFTFNDDTYLGDEITTYSDGISYYAGLDPGQSFYYEPDDAYWFDAKYNGFCNRIKGLATDTTCVHDYPAANDQIIPPTEDTDGYTLHTCSRCGHQMKDSLTLRTHPVPGTPKLHKLKRAGKKALKVFWYRHAQQLAGEHITGYQIRCSLKKNMKGSKRINAAGYETVSKKIKKLKSNKKYYIQLRTYFDSNDTRYYSGWSEKLAIKTR